MWTDKFTQTFLKKGLLLILLITVIVFYVLDLALFRHEHIELMINKTRTFFSAESQTAPAFNESYEVLDVYEPISRRSRNSSGAAKASKVSWLDSQPLFVQDVAIRELANLGYDSTQNHAFKSPYISTPKIYSDRRKNNLSQPTEEERNAKVKVISCFNCPPWFSSSSFNQYNADFKACPYSDCYFDRDGANKSTADVLLIFVGRLGAVPKPARPPGQIWVKCYWESPAHYGYPTNYDIWKDAFNWTFNYRVDSDIFAPNNRLAWRHPRYFLKDSQYVEFAKNKTKTAAWWVSNCNSVSKRRKYVNEMKKYIDIDIYGRCGTLVCPRDNPMECEGMLNHTYKFYLSFENSLCTDYVTEKYFDRLKARTQIVPVVRGGFDYDKYIPPGGFINAAHFKGPKELALYLKDLGNDPIRYAKILQEKDKLVTLQRKFDWCDICEKIHTDKEIKIIPDIKAWSHDSTCHNPRDLG